MAPRNPKENPQKTIQDETLQVAHAALTGETNVQAEAAKQGVPVPAVRQETEQDTKVELDRVQVYLKGPTVFSA